MYSTIPRAPGDPARIAGRGVGGRLGGFRDTYLARQPILDARHKVVGYELWFRTGEQADSAECLQRGDTEATAGILVDMFGTLGASSLLGSTLGFVDVTPDLLQGELLEALPKDRVVLEIPRMDAIPDGFEARCQDLAAHGIALALDDYRRRDPRESLLVHSRYAKVDVSGKDWTDTRALVRTLKRTPVAVVAYKVESSIEFGRARDAGFNLFQGYYFAKPVTVSGRRLDPASSTVLDLMTRLGEDCDFAEVSEALKQHVGLCVQLLRLVNAAGFNRTAKVESVTDAIVMIGRSRLARWLTLLLYASADADGMSHPLMLTAARRGRTIELLAAQLTDSSGRVGPDGAFLVGMLSLVDALLGLPMDEVLRQINPSDKIRHALTDRSGHLGKLLLIEERTEVLDFVEVGKLLDEVGLDSEDLGAAQRNAHSWAESIYSG